MKNGLKQIRNMISRRVGFMAAQLIFLSSLFFIFHFSFFIFPVYAASASLSLLPASGTYKIGDSFDAAVNLNTGGEPTSGADAILLYEPEKLEAQSITVGSIYSSYPIKTINSTAGKISISGIISDATSSFTGEGVFASIKLKALTSGTTTIQFDFQPGQPTDSNVAKKGTKGEDVLASVSNATYTIAGSAGDGFPSPMPTSTPTPPVAGVWEITAAVLLAGLGFIIFGLGWLRKALDST